MMNELEIRTLTERFFNGDTTLAEERRLYQLYSEAETLPADLLPLREMMLDLGRLDAQIPSTQIPTPNPSRGEGSLISFVGSIISRKRFQTPLPS